MNTDLFTEWRVQEFAAFFQAVLADELRSLGIRTCVDRDLGEVVVTGVPEHIIEAFSERARRPVLNQVLQYARLLGLDWDALAAEDKVDLVRAAASDGHLD